MKSVMISIRPEWVNKILDGKKTIEIRKTAPKIATPFKCYIYMTAGSRKFSGKPGVIPDAWRRYAMGVTRMVVAEFICDKIVTIKVFNNGTIQDWNWNELERSCVPYDDIVRYIGNNRSGYGWNISDLKIYDKPKQITDFSVFRNIPVEYAYGTARQRYTLERPPQSWCYVEELRWQPN